MSRRNLAGIYHGSPVYDFLDSDGPRGNRLAVGGVRLPVRTGGTLPGHKPARLDIGRNDLACRLDLQVCTLNPVLPRLPAARVVRRARKVLSSRSIADESPSP
jgi:hypothetical protein